MAMKDCPAGSFWDTLVGNCINNKTETRHKPEPPTKPPLADVIKLRATTPTAQANLVMVLSPALWIFVVLATLGSILALVHWFIIYRRQTSHSNTLEDAELQQESLQKTEPPSKVYPRPSERNSHAEMLQREAGAPSPCPHLCLGAQTDLKWKEGFTACRDHAKHSETEGGGGLSACSTMREHRVPLPATELGGTALVTTKTV
ncbi:tumor necrosis factor receptor superfamily member 13C-like [Enoplosus armatus]|uniref:tumor necrosis factor receptor superfamily member 13C-like n=1 Tax=Enoplosus armatus TaxID=215367 RepID=UPI003994247A